MKYHIYTLGCKFNLYESARISEMLENDGYERSEPDEADIIIINSCAVTSEACRQSLQIARHFKRKSTAKIIFTGCATHDNVNSDFDLVIGNGEKMQILDYLDKTGKFESPSYFLKDSMDYSVSKIPERTRGFLSVENGCNWGCTYCAIPHFRGTTVRSKPLNTAIDEATEMIRLGIKEIVVSGINIALYDDKGLKLKGLLENLSKIEGDFRIRLSSIDPLNAAELEPLFEKHSKLCHHMHLSLQSGSNFVLKEMGRHYTTDDVFDIVKKFRSRDPFFAFSADIITGFPSETSDEFNETVELLEKIKVMKIHVFPFSSKSGTRASKIINVVDNVTKKHRAKMLRDLSLNFEKKFRFDLKGLTKKVLVEEKHDEFCEGFSEHYLKYAFKCTNAEIGDFVQIDL